MNGVGSGGGGGGNSGPTDLRVPGEGRNECEPVTLFKRAKLNFFFFVRRQTLLSGVSQSVRVCGEGKVDGGGSPAPARPPLSISVTGESVRGDETDGDGSFTEIQE